MKQYGQESDEVGEQKGDCHRLNTRKQEISSMDELDQEKFVKSDAPLVNSKSQNSAQHKKEEITQNLNAKPIIPDNVEIDDNNENLNKTLQPLNLSATNLMKVEYELPGSYSDKNGSKFGNFSKKRSIRSRKFSSMDGFQGEVRK